MAPEYAVASGVGAGLDASAAPAEPDYLLERWGWLVRLRWMAVGGVLATIGIAAAFQVVDTVAPLLLVTFALAAGNVYAWSRWRIRLKRPGGGPHSASIFWQLVGDVVALALLLHFAGGAENPFAMFFAFHMALGAMLLPGSLPLYLSLVAAVLHGSVVLGEFARILHHHSLFTVEPGEAPAHPALLWRTPGFVLGYLVAFNLMLFGVVYFVRSVVERQRYADDLRRERERLAVARERFARIGELAAGVAHAVRNPLHGLVSSVDLLLARAGSDSSDEETLSLMGEACRRIESVTQRLLVLTRDAQPARKPIELERLVAEAAKLASPRARGSNVLVETRLDAGGLVEADRDRLMEALINVIDNAVDACREGGRVTVRTSAMGPDAVCIEVIDTGAGIAPEHLGKVFDPFYTTKAVGEGTGLGLPIARRIVEEHGGEVTIDGAGGKGTRVRFVMARGVTTAARKEQA